jgi:hypothetical protein
MKNSSHTGRFPRCMESAFGPYNRSSQCAIQPMTPDRIPSFDLALYLVAVLALIVLIGVL